MIPVDYELGRQYQLERVDEANNHRLLGQAVPRRQSHDAHAQESPIAGPVRARIVRVVAAATRRVSTQVRSSLTAT